LAKWLATRLAEGPGGAPGAADLAIGELSVPPATGFSNETILFDAHWSTTDGSPHDGRYVLRVGPSGYSVFYDPQFEEQYRILDALGQHTDVPVPNVRWYEDDASLLGAPFFVMDRVEGQAPSDTPEYTTTGFMFDATAEQQRRAYDSGLQAMARVHAVDWRGAGLSLLDKPARGAIGFDQQLSYYQDYYAWAGGGAAHPVLDPAFEWVERHRPTPGSEEVALCWGDARVGNILFDDFCCAAVLDWEMAALGNPIADLAWWKFLDRHHSEAIGVPRLPGFLSHDATIARYEALTGRSVDRDALDFYEVFAGVRFGVVMVRIAQLVVEFGLLPPDTDLARNNNVTRLLAPMVGAPTP
jgi:aminoglycoside phosphotransferase (APT) family kinase protein